MKPIILLLFALLTSFIFSQSLVKLKLPNNCNSGSITTNTENALSDINSKLELFPNPNSGNFTLIISFNDIIDKALISVYNTDGKSIYSETVFSDSKKLVKQLHIGGLLNGTYVFEVKNAKNVSVTKLVINK